jgi:hypothetical protein
MNSLATLVLLASLAGAGVADMPEGHPGVTRTPQGGQIEAMKQQGEVVTVVDTMGFTYIEVKQDTRTVWVAAPTVDIRVGDTVHFQDAPAMANYHSKSLDRTFTNVIFVSNISVDSVR